MRLRLASVNLFSGRSLADGRIEPGRVHTALAGLDADVLALQEVDRGQPRSGGADQARLAARATGAVTYRFVPLVAGTPGVPGWVPVDVVPGRLPADGDPADADPADADPADDDPTDAGPCYGIALASRRPVASWHVLPLPPPPGRWPIPVPSRPARLLWIKDEPRAAVAAVLERPRLVVAGTHLSFVPGVNAWQLRRLRAWLAALARDVGAPAVLLGDLNLPGRLPALITGWTPLVTGPTYPAPAPRVQVDHALMTGTAAAGDPAATGRVVPLPFSDHRALVVNLELQVPR